jgi:probable rRNA maturation factor
VIEVEIFGATTAFEGSSTAVPPLGEMRRLCVLAAASAGIREGHLAIEFADSERIAKLNVEHRRERGATDVLSFPVDGIESHEGVPRELGDVIICPEQTVDLREAIVHGVLHLMGMDHEVDDGEMLALQAELLTRDRDGRGWGSGGDLSPGDLSPDVGLGRPRT